VPLGIVLGTSYRVLSTIELSLPQLNDVVPPARHDSRRLDGMPLDTNAGPALVRVEAPVHLRCPPVPKPQRSVPVPRAEEFTVRGEGDLARKAGGDMTFKVLFLQLLELRL
jgi:hypothetical protein